MKKQLNPLFLLFFFLITAFQSAHAENDPVTLAWKGAVKVPDLNRRPATIPTFSGAIIDYKARLPQYSLRLENVTASQFTLKNPVYAPLTPEEAKFLPKEQLKSTPVIRISHGIANGKATSIITFVPLRLNPQNGQLEKLTQFEYTYTQNPTAKKEQVSAARSRTYKTNSVLSSGAWFKIGVPETGIYKIDRKFLQDLGINLNGLNPRHIQLYGNGGGMLPQANAAPRHDDLVENAILINGEQDGSFDADDYLLFYGQGPHAWHPNAARNGFSHSLNIYSDTTYYFVTVGNAPGRRITSANVPAPGSAPTITTFNERDFHELERVNLLISGREWYGEEFNAYNLNFSKTFTRFSDLVPNTPVAVTSSVLGISPVLGVGGKFTVNLNNVTLGTQETSGHGGGDYHDAGDDDSTTFVLNLNSIPYNNSDLRVDISFNQMGLSSATGHLDYLLINAERQLKLYGNQTTFRTFQNLAPNATSFFRVGNVAVNPSESYVWDVTNPLRPRNLNAKFENYEATFYAKTDTLREFIIFTGSAFPSPTPFGYFPNQNLHSLNQDGKTDLVIVTHPSLYNQAQRLANHRASHDKLKVAVVTTTQVFNEFSSGAQDVTAIRDMMKMFYQRKIANNTKTNDSLIYLLILGDASYDYKSKFPNTSQNRTQNNTNLVPVYESRQSLSATWTFSSEDYYGLLDDTEGYWTEFGQSNPDLLDIGIGRIPAKTRDEADIMINKIINYSNPDHFGKWRNQVSLIADDGDGNQHLAYTEDLVRILQTRYPNYSANKVYLDLYKQVAAANGQRSPDCVADIDRAVEQGSLLINYVGHGGETGLAAEQIVTVNQINNWNNYNRPTFLVTATCEFGRYDDPRRNSAAELSFLNPNGGAIGLITTTRPVYSNTNAALNTSFFNCVFEKINGRTPRLGDILLTTKNNAVDIGNRNFTLLCDPTMKLAYPEEKVKANSITVAGSTATDTISALSTVTLTGTVTNAGNQVLADFNGKVQITVFEKPTVATTLGDHGSAPIPIAMLKSVLYDGTVTAKNGNWTSTFVVPKDINYLYGKGKISLYAYSNTVDGHGAKTDIIIGGSSSNIAADTIPPVISLFMDNESFVFGGLTGNNTLLISHLSDDSGINTAGLGIGHEITATLDGDKENVKVLNEYYTADLDKFTSGKVRYQFKNLKPGPHELRVKAWDTHNNSSEKRIEFVVANSEGLALDHVLNYPNPFSTNTTFHFDHNRAGEDLDIQIQIFTVSGKLVKTLNAQSFASKPHVSEISWNGRDEYNDALAKGVYIYKLNVRSGRDGNKVSRYEKLVLLN